MAAGVYHALIYFLKYSKTFIIFCKLHVPTCNTLHRRITYKCDHQKMRKSSHVSLRQCIDENNAHKFVTVISEIRQIYVPAVLP